MQTKEMCHALTQSGRRCRNPALANTDPPACWRHQRQQPTPPRPRPVSTAQLAPVDTSRTLAGELAVVRHVLQRLVERLDEPAFALETDELRQLAGLIFSGARTVAYLLQQQSGSDANALDWLDEALDALKKRYGVEL